MELIKSVCYGNLIIYPSELKRAGIPLALYKYITLNTFKKKDFNIKSIIHFWSSRFSFYKKKDFPTLLLYDDIISRFLIEFSLIIDRPDKKIKIKLLLKIKLPEYFYYLDCTLANKNHEMEKKMKVVSEYINNDLCSIIEYKALHQSLYCDIYKTILESMNKMAKEVLGLPMPNNYESKDYIQDGIYVFSLYMIQKYFEYRMVKYKEKKLFGKIIFRDILY